MNVQSPHTDKLHIVSFQVPYPPTYGGVIDVYYKLKALKKAGCHITLHTYRYRLPEAPSLTEVADKIFYYKRETGIRSQLSGLPYIVYSRRDKELLHNLCTDNAPILFEGLHTCYFLNHPSLQQRVRIVRAHNVEHHYYQKLGKAAFPRPVSAYYFLEAIKLKHYEPVLRSANALLAITPEEHQYFRTHYPDTPSYTIPCFFDEHAMQAEEPDSTPQKTRSYMLYHGNLSVAENIHAAMYILQKIMPMLPAEHEELVIAGKDPSEQLRRMISGRRRVRLIANPTEPEMDTLIREAHINLLPTFQNTGFKLKLIHALTKGRGYCLVNTPMLSDPALSSVCLVADTPEQFAETIGRLTRQEPTQTELEQRISFLRNTYSNTENAKRILEIIQKHTPCI